MASDCEKTDNARTRSRIRLYCAYDMWIEHRDAFGRGLQLTSKESLNEKFALHLLKLHTKCKSCHVPPRDAVGAVWRPAEEIPDESLAPAPTESSVPFLNLDPSGCPSAARPNTTPLAPIKRTLECQAMIPAQGDTSPGKMSRTPTPGNASPEETGKGERPSENEDFYRVVCIKEEVEEGDWIEGDRTNMQITEPGRLSTNLDGNLSQVSTNQDTRLPSQPSGDSRAKGDLRQLMDLKGNCKVIEKGVSDILHECGLITSSSEESVTDEDEFSCADNQEVFIQEPVFADRGASETASSEDEYLRTNSGEKPHNCSLCNREFSRGSHLRRHMKIHTGEKPHDCPYCDQRFAEKGNLTEHVRMHTGEKYVCSHCNEAFPSINHLKRHTRNTHAGEMPHQCSLCDEAFATLSYLARHMQRHLIEEAYHCSYCDKSFNKQNYTQHIMTHTGERPHKCSLCGKGFSRTSNLARHLRSHRGEKPYGCSLCDKRFSEKKTSIQHMRTHSGEKPHCCTVCSRRFAEKTYLTEHMRQHSGEKPYVCSYCNKAFARRSSRLNHVRTHFLENIYHCLDCNKEFRSRLGLSKHLNSRSHMPS